MAAANNWLPLTASVEVAFSLPGATLCKATVPAPAPTSVTSLDGTSGLGVVGKALVEYCSGALVWSAATVLPRLL